MTTAQAGYQSGFGNEFATEALAGRLAGRTQLAAALPLGLYAEQLSGHAPSPRRAAPTAARGCTASARRRRTCRSSAMDAGRIVSDFSAVPAPPNQLRWNPLPMPAEPTDFIDGLTTWPATATRTRKPARHATSTPRTAR